MNTKPHIAVVLSMLAAGLALHAAQVEKPATPPIDREKAATAAAEGVKNNPIRKGTALVGREVKAPGGAAVGTLRDLVIDSASGQVAYAVIQLTPTETRSDTHVAVPFSAMQEDAARQNLILDVTPAQLDAARGFSADAWPTMTDEAWAKQTHALFKQRPYWEDDRADEPTAAEKDTNKKNPIDPADPDDARTTREPAKPNLSKDHFWTNRLTQMLGKPVTNAAGESLGTLSDVVIDMRGRAVYGVVKPGEADAKLAALPWSAVQAEGAKQRYVVEADRALLDFAGFKQSAWPNMYDVYWARKNHEHFKREPYWMVYGYPIEDEYGIPWRSSSAYSKAFAGRPSGTLEGFVHEIKQFSPERGADKGTVVILKMEDGSMRTVHLGPAAYIDLKREKFNLRKGEKITVTGPTGQFEGDEVVQAWELKSGDGSLQIRDEKGRPEWEQDSRQRNREFRRQIDREKKKEKVQPPDADKK